MSLFKTDKRLFMVGSWWRWVLNSCTLFLITNSSKSSRGLYCPRCGDESVPVSRSSFRTRRSVLLLNPVAWTVCWIYTQTKKKRPIFMVLYLSIQLRFCNKNKTKMLIKRPTHKKLVVIWFYLLIFKGYWTSCAHSFFHYYREVNHQNVIHFTLNGKQKRPTMKKHKKIPSLLIERAKIAISNPSFTKLSKITSLWIK